MGSQRRARRDRLALVTGGAGFIGAHLCGELLAAGWRVRVLDNFSAGRRENLPRGVQVQAGDVCDPQAAKRSCRGVDTVFHLAARVSIRQSMESFVGDASTNVLGTLNILRAAGAAGARRFILASSMAVYADAPDRRPVKETHPTAPLSPYGIGKLAAEHYVLRLGPRLGLEPVALRFFNTFGRRQGITPYVGVVTIFITRIIQGRAAFIYGDGRQCRDFTHVSDVAAACRLAAEAPRAVGQALNVGSGIGTTVRELADLLRERLGRGSFCYVPARPEELCYSVADLTLARRRLGYCPRVRLEDRLGEVIEDLSGRLRGGKRGP